jgi:hypothetical protein
MPGALGDIIDAIQTGLGQIPPAAIVVGLLFGPTLAYFLYRFYAGPRAAPAVAEADELYWICQDCRSANDRGQHRCYHCHADRDAIAGALQVIDHDQLLELDVADGPDQAAATSPGVAVGPGRADPTTPFPTPAVVRDPVQDHPIEVVTGRTPVAIPIEPEEEEDDVLAASQSVSATPARRRRRSSARDAGR